MLDSVEFHELLHVVRVDPDDGISDFLIVPDQSVDLVPNLIYTSHDGTNPLPVTMANITDLSYTSARQIQVSSG